jgi:hypothetical protein
LKSPFFSRRHRTAPAAFKAVMSTPNWEDELLLSSLGVPPSGDGPAALRRLLSGDFAGALSLALHEVWPLEPDTKHPESVPEWFGRFCSVLAAAGPLNGEKARTVLLAGVAALHVFIQANLTGPSLPAGLVPECPFDALSPSNIEGSETEAAAAEAGAAAPVAFGIDTASPGDRWAAAQLSENGEELVGRMVLPQYLVLAKSVLLAGYESPSDLGKANGNTAEEGNEDENCRWPGTDVRSWPWWAMRVALTQQRALEARSAALSSLLARLAGETLLRYAHEPAGGWGAMTPPAMRILASGALLEAALAETAFGRAAEAEVLLRMACEAAGLRAELTGRSLFLKLYFEP